MNVLLLLLLLAGAGGRHTFGFLFNLEKLVMEGLAERGRGGGGAVREQALGAPAGSHPVSLSEAGGGGKMGTKFKPVPL